MRRRAARAARCIAAAIDSGIGSARRGSGGLAPGMSRPARLLVASQERPGAVEIEADEQSVESSRLLLESNRMLPCH